MLKNQNKQFLKCITFSFYWTNEENVSYGWQWTKNNMIHLGTCWRSPSMTSHQSIWETSPGKEWHEVLLLKPPKLWRMKIKLWMSLCRFSMGKFIILTAHIKEKSENTMAYCIALWLQGCRWRGANTAWRFSPIFYKLLTLKTIS